MGLTVELGNPCMFRAQRGCVFHLYQTAVQRKLVVGRAGQRETVHSPSIVLTAAMLQHVRPENRRALYRPILYSGIPELLKPRRTHL